MPGEAPRSPPSTIGSDGRAMGWMGKREVLASAPEAARAYLWSGRAEAGGAPGARMMLC